MRTTIQIKNGPEIHLKIMCNNCTYLKTKSCSSQINSPLDYYCSFNEPHLPIPYGSETPGWCPLITDSIDFMNSLEKGIISNIKLHGKEEVS